MKVLDQLLGRHPRPVRQRPDQTTIVAELRGIREALQCICREAFNVELAPANEPAYVGSDPNPEYVLDGGMSEIDRVAALMRAAGLDIADLDSPPRDPVDDGALQPLAQSPFMLHPDEEAANEPIRIRHAAAGRTDPDSAGQSLTAADADD